MNKTKNFVWIITVIAFLGLGFILYKTVSTHKDLPNNNNVEISESVESDEFSDGLPNPDSVITYQLKELETGISEKYIYDIDINKDGKPDRITKSFFDNGNAHSYYKYTIEINNNGKYIDITPDKLQTTNGADCDLRQIQFKFKPEFQIIVIYREMADTWDEPTMATKLTYALQKNSLVINKVNPMRPVCDVKELF